MDLRPTKTEEKLFEGILRGLVALFRDDLLSIGSEWLTDASAGCRLLLHRNIVAQRGMLNR